MTNIIKEIRKIIGDHWTSEIGIRFYGEEIVFFIYESEVPVRIDKKLDVYIDTETMNHTLTSSMLEELGRIVKLLEDNKEILSKFLYEPTK